jgi:hypothetical protein
MKDRPRGIIQRFKIERILEVMEDNDSASLQAALEDPDIPHVAIAEVLSKRGHRISTNAVRNYRFALEAARG